MSTTRPVAERGDRTVSLRRMPRWYVTLFSSDLLERFGFYAMQAVLVLYAAAPASGGGLGLATADAAGLFGAWIGVMFVLSLPGGWLGDRVLGHRRAMIAGCVAAVLGYLCLAIPGGWTAAAGLSLVAIGGGMFKSNQNALTNLMFGGHRGRESGISLMYVGTQVSALLAPLVTGFLGERGNWPAAFAVAAVAMAVCGVLLAVTARQFAEVGTRPARPLDAPERRRALRRTGAVVVVLAAVLAGFAVGGVLGVTAVLALSGLLSIVAPVVGYVLLYREKALGPGDRRRLRAFLAVFLGATLFWMIIAHSASLLNLFARDHIDRDVLGFTVPASWLQSATPVFILLLAPAVATVLPRIGERHNVAVKFSAGLLLVGTGFVVMAVAALIASDGSRLSPLWLVAVYLTHACGEVTIAAVSISAAADVLPRQFLGRTLGMLWLFAALGGGVGSVVVRLRDVVPEPGYYLGLGGLALVCGVVFALRRRTLTRALAKDEAFAA
ncbi:peptide MFS transporter [Amycolatopsis rubida]|uniref:Proton-dependent oligopeptide transporter, POT family n=1 Tax=Amycolatopsis rubida TaxID=112413 RepID=A0A1I5TGY6_9PSEU|nr:oligopeptide:H+ symporter [Amycolatopsis rubida]SFP82342.1 proton-dependent oligopeptide transporter, POT family [Amycolatopsis rubida]